MSFSNYIKTVRKQYGLTQASLSEKLNISRNAVKLIEDGSTKYPSDKVLNNLSELLDIPRYTVMAEILFGNGNEDDHISYYRSIEENYLAYMYLRGWNVEPIDHSFFDGKIIKKREPKNIVFVTSAKNTDITDYEMAEDYLSHILLNLLKIDDEFRGFHLVFDNSDKDEDLLFYEIKNLKLKRITFDFQVVLFDVDKSRVEEMVNLREK